MKILFKLILIVGVSLYLVLPALAIEFFDINKPRIEKLNLSINKSGDSDLVDLLVEQLRSQMGRTLLFNILDDTEESTFNLKISPTNDQKIVSVTLSGAQGQGFEPITTGMKFRDQDKEYVNLKSSQLGNFLIKNLMGIQGSLGGIVVWSESKKGENKNSLVMRRFGSDIQKQITYNLYNNTGVSWSPKGDAIIYSAQTDSGSNVFWQGFNPLRLKSERVFSSEGTSSSATWGNNGNIYLAKYMGDKNTDLIEYTIVSGGTGHSLEMSRKLTKHMAIETEPALSPDGKTLAYISDRTGTPQVYLLNLATKKTTRLTKKGNYNSSPSWSPDGTMIAYNGVRNSKSVIFRVLVDDPLGFETQVSPKGMQAESPVWSSDGSLVAYQAKKTGQQNWKIYYSLSSGSSAQRLTKSKRGVDETSPSWNSGLR
jgi:dipeptidyl aminopeptidase/acylaminoacyl peptidase